MKFTGCSLSLVKDINSVATSVVLHRRVTISGRHDPSVVYLGHIYGR